jgi:predicted amidohydrolase YtcJ
VRPSAIAVADGRVVAIGADAAELRDAGAGGAEVFDFPGACLLPGFWDTHVHVERVGLISAGCMLYEASSVAGIQETLAAHAAAVPEREVIYGRAGCLHPAMLAEGRLPDRRDLDEAVPDRPVVFHDVDKAFANSAALRAAGVTAASPDPEGGRIDRDEDGQPTGVCWFRGGQGLFNKLIALRPAYGPEEYAERYREGCLQLASRGVTTVIQAYARSEQIGAIRKLDAEGRLPCRSIVQPAGVRGDDFEDFLSSPFEFGQRLGELSCVGPFKLLYDLFVMHRSARVSRHYRGQPENFGSYNTSPEELVTRINAAMARGFAVGVHVTGDEGLDEAVEAIGAELKARGGAAPEGSFLIHGYFASPGAPGRMADLGLGLAAQPVFHYAWADQVEEFVGTDRTGDFYPYDRYLEAGVTVAGGSDAPVAWYDPLCGVCAAATRRSASGKVWGPEHAVDVETALSFYTDSAARLVPWSGLSGRLEPGEPADFVVLDRDPREVSPEDVRSVKVLATYVAGREVYRAGGAEP